MSKSHLTNFGIPGIGIVPYGIHMCHFYASRQELLDGLIPFFRAGLTNKERCLWVASSPLPANEIRSEIGTSVDLQQGLTSGQLEVFEALSWYGAPGNLTPQELVTRLIDEEQRAVDEGFNGLRIAGNTTFVLMDNWGHFMEYEQQLHQSLHGHRVVICCSYHRKECHPVDLLEVVNRHHGAVDYWNNEWQLHTNGKRFSEGELKSIEWTP
ncbi:MAG TPA: MEDS domain-containing protein [Candidatus Obscuribacterales bacterium]